MRLRNRVVRLLAFAVFFLIAASTAFSNESTRIISEKDLMLIGYKSTKTHRYSSRCNSYETHKPKNILYQGIKSNKALKNYKNTFFRYTLIKEVHVSATQASMSLKANKQVDADSWYSKICGLKQGIQHGRVLYYLSTDAGLFSSELPKVLDKVMVLLK